MELAKRFGVSRVDGDMGVIMERQGRRAPHSEPARCDHCRKSFGLILHRYYRMRFCSDDCLRAYQRRLDDLTMTRIQCVDQSRALPNWAGNNAPAPARPSCPLTRCWIGVRRSVRRV